MCNTSEKLDRSYSVGRDNLLKIVADCNIMDVGSEPLQEAIRAVESPSLERTRCGPWFHQWTREINEQGP